MIYEIAARERTGRGGMIGRAGKLGNPGFPAVSSGCFFSKNGVRNVCEAFPPPKRSRKTVQIPLIRVEFCERGFLSPLPCTSLKTTPMSDTGSAPASGPGFRPEELPPVTPPSAGFIVQLFVIPALIVMAVVAVWALFGKLADSGSDWQQLVAELGGGNEHRRWRAAQELAQVLHNERLAPPTDREPLATNPLVARALSDLLRETLASPSTAPETIMQQEFLARALGGIEADETTLPVLALTLTSDRAPDVRRSGLMAVTAISGRHFDRAMGYDAQLDPDTTPPSRTPLDAPTINNANILQELRVAAQDQDAVIRHIAAYALGNVSGPDSISQLQVMLGDSDDQARANAAMALARNGEATAFPVVLELLQSLTQPAPPAAPNPAESASAASMPGDANRRAEQPVLARNCLRAVRDLWNKLTPDDQQQTLVAIQALADADSLMADIRVQARNLLSTIQSESSSAPNSEAVPAERAAAQ